MKALILDLHKNLRDIVGEKLDPEDYKSYKESFNDFDKQSSGKIPVGSLQAAMRRGGKNPTDVEVTDIINKYDNGTGYLDFQEFCYIMEDGREEDQETGYKETFRVFGKDESGCIHPSEIQFVLQHLPSQLEPAEIEEMIDIVDKNKDGKISYSEFRVMLGAIPLIIPQQLPTTDKQVMKKGETE